MKKYRELEDGTRIYRGGMKYKPVAAEKRKYRKHKPEGVGWVRSGNRWYTPLVLLPDEVRIMPDTFGVDLVRTKRARRKHEREKNERLHG